MVLINYAGREINAKIVYYGPGLSGKTTNLECIYASVPTTSRGKMVSMKTRQDRTLFFDFLPLELGEVHGFRTRFLLYTVPGQVFYNATRKLVLKGADAVVFVADSGLGRVPENLESLHNLEENLREQGLAIENLPFVIQYNKRDLPQLHSIEELETALNPRRVPSFEAAAATGRGVYETLHAVSRLLFQRLMNDLRPGGVRPGAPATTSVPAQPATATPLAGLVPAAAPAAVRPAAAAPRVTPASAGPSPSRTPSAPASFAPAPSGASPVATATQARPAAPPRPAPPEVLAPAPWQEGEQEPHFAVDAGTIDAASSLPLPAPPRAAPAVPEFLALPVLEPSEPGQVPPSSTSEDVFDTVQASTQELTAEPASRPPAEYSQYGHVIDLVHGDPATSSAPEGGFIKDPLRRTEKQPAAPGRGSAPTARPTRTQYLSVVLTQTELRPGGTIRIVLDVQVEP
jgi:mutual gliding-motility protein MglA